MGRLRTPLVLAAALTFLGCGGGDGDSAQNAETSPPPAPRVAPADQGSETVQPTGGAVTLAGIRFAPPEDWRDLGPNAMRKAQYTLAPVEGDTDPAEVNVFYFGSTQGGDIESNIVRWIGQMSAPDGGDASKLAVRSKLTTGNGLDVHFVEVDGTYNMSMGGGPMTGGRTKAMEGYRMVGAIVEAPEGNVFFKLTGPQATARVMEADLREMIGDITRV